MTRLSRFPFSFRKIKLLVSQTKSRSFKEDRIVSYIRDLPLLFSSIWAEPSELRGTLFWLWRCLGLVFPAPFYCLFAIGWRRSFCPGNGIRFVTQSQSSSEFFGHERGESRLPFWSKSKNSFDGQLSKRRKESFEFECGSSLNGKRAGRRISLISSCLSLSDRVERRVLDRYRPNHSISSMMMAKIGTEIHP